MTFAPDVTQRLARARADLRMGVPVVLDKGAVILAAETLDAARLARAWRCAGSGDYRLAGADVKGARL